MGIARVDGSREERGGEREIMTVVGMRINAVRTPQRSVAVRRCALRTRKAGKVRCSGGEVEATTGAIQVNTSTWDEKVLKSSVPVLVDFWAPWCGPCRMIEPSIDQLADEYEGKIAAVKLNTDESPDIATKYGIRSIPTVTIFKNGEKVETVIGAVPKNTLTNTIDKHL